MCFSYKILQYIIVRYLLFSLSSFSMFHGCYILVFYSLLSHCLIIILYQCSNCSHCSLQCSYSSHHCSHYVLLCDNRPQIKEFWVFWHQSHLWQNTKERRENISKYQSALFCWWRHKMIMWLFVPFTESTKDENTESQASWERGLGMRKA